MAIIREILWFVFKFWVRTLGDYKFKKKDGLHWPSHYMGYASLHIVVPTISFQ